MELLSIRLDNWRVFQGIHEIHFSTNLARPLTLLLGANGSGKTALLNAFTWCLYDEFTEGFRDPENLVTMEAVELTGPATPVSIEIRFRHDEDEFHVVRSTDKGRHASGENDLKVKKNGTTVAPTEIYRILPKDLKDLFFFPAETLSTANVVSGASNVGKIRLDVGAAIRSLLSGDIYDNASHDLDRAMDHPILKPPKKYTSETVDRYRKEYEQAKASLSALEHRHGALPGLLHRAEQAAKDAKEVAERYDPERIREYQDRHQELADTEQGWMRVLVEARGVFAEVIRSSHHYLSECAINTAVARLDQAEQIGLMPPRIAPEVMRMTLERDTNCALCGEPLTPKARDRISTLADRVGNSELAARGMEVRSLLRKAQETKEHRVSALVQRISKLAIELHTNGPGEDIEWPALVAAASTLVDIADKGLSQARHDFEEFQDQYDREDVPPEGESPVERAMAAQSRVDKIEAELAVIPGRIEEAKRAHDKALDEYKKRSGKSREHRQKTEAIAILSEAKDYFDAAKKGLNGFGRKDFERAINDTYRDLVKKPYEIKVADNFSVAVYQEGTEKRVPPGQAETVLLTIAFLGAIARLAPHYEEIAKRNEQLKSTGEVETSARKGFPVVLDAPTSPLDAEYEPIVVDALPNLLPQVIVPTSSKSVQVWETIAERIGATYILELSSSKSSDQTISWGGRDYDYTRHDPAVPLGHTRIVTLDNAGTKEV